MKNKIEIILLFVIISVITGCGEGRREPTSKMQYRQGLYYMVNEQDPYTGIFFEQYKSGQMWEEFACKNGKENGIHKKWHENGQIQYEGALKDGKKEGVWKKWYENGQINEECTYSDGKHNGAYKVWHENGQIKYEGIFSNGKKEGVWKIWHANGRYSQMLCLRNFHSLSKLSLSSCLS